MIQFGPFKTWEKAVAEAENHKGEFHTAYARPNQNEEEGGFVVVCENRPWWNTPVYGGCPRGK